MSMITEQIKNLRKVAEYPATDGSIKWILRGAADTIEELSSKLHAANMGRSSQYYHGGWIPVEEVEHPQKEGLYWVHEQNYGGKEDAQFHEHVEHTIFWNGKVWFGRYYDDGYSYIVAWRPLPEPYKAESEDKE